MTSCMTPCLRLLDPVTDRDSVDDLFRRSADYVRLERGAPPGPGLVEEFFTDAPPGCDLAQSLKLGLCVPGQPLAAIADLGFGYPAASDAYLGLLQFAEDQRGQGLGAMILRRIEAIAMARGATRLLLAVLHDNPRGRAFWMREGFAVEAENRAVTLGAKSHLATRMAKTL